MAAAKTWAKRVASWRASGQTADAFAAGRGFAASTLRWWGSRLGRRDSGFVQVVTAPVAVARDGVVELDVGGVRVLVRVGFDRAVLAAVLDVLRDGATS